MSFRGFIIYPNHHSFLLIISLAKKNQSIVNNTHAIQASTVFIHSILHVFSLYLNHESDIISIGQIIGNKYFNCS
jgi:hypothetical protein